MSRATPTPDPTTGSALGNALPDYLVTPTGTLFTTGRDETDGGLPLVRSVAIGPAGVVRLRGLVHGAGLDEHETTPADAADAKPADPVAVEVGYRHPSGRLVSTRSSLSDAGVAALLAAVARPSTLGARTGAARVRPAVLRLYGVTGASADAPRSAADIGRWRVLSATLASTSLRCVAVRGGDAQRLRAELARLAAHRDSNVLIDDRGIASAWMQSGNVIVRLGVRVVLPGEPDCPAMAR